MPCGRRTPALYRGGVCPPPARGGLILRYAPPIWGGAVDWSPPRVGGSYYNQNLQDFGASCENSHVQKSHFTPGVFTHLFTPSFLGTQVVHSRSLPKRRIRTRTGSSTGTGWDEANGGVLPRQGMEIEEIEEGRSGSPERSMGGRRSDRWGVAGAIEII